MFLRLAPLLLLAALVPLLFSACAAQSPDANRGLKSRPANAQAEARVAIAHLCDAQHIIDDFIADSATPTPDWPQPYAEAYRDFAMYARTAREEVPVLKATFQRVADGDLSVEAINAMTQAAQTAQRRAEEFAQYKVKLESLARQLSPPTPSKAEMVNGSRPQEARIDGWRVAIAPLPESTRRRIYFELARAQDLGVGDTQAYKLIATKYGIETETVYEIAGEGAVKHWPLPPLP